MCNLIFYAQTWIDFHSRSIRLHYQYQHYITSFENLSNFRKEYFFESDWKNLIAYCSWNEVESTLWVLLEISIPRNLNKCILLKPVWYDSIKFIRHVWPHSTLNEFTSYCKEQYCSNTLWIRSNLICVEKRFRT